MNINDERFVNGVLMQPDIFSDLKFKLPSCEEARFEVKKVSSVLNLNYTQAFNRLHFAVQLDNGLHISYDIHWLAAKFIRYESENYNGNTYRAYFKDSNNTIFDFLYKKAPELTPDCEYGLIGFYYITPRCNRHFAPLSVEPLTVAETSFIESFKDEFNFNLDDININHRLHYEFESNTTNFSLMFKKKIGFATNMKGKTKEHVFEMLESSDSAKINSYVDDLYKNINYNYNKGKDYDNFGINELI